MADLKEQYVAKMQGLECQNTVLEDNLKLKDQEYNDLAEKFENLRIETSKSESEHREQVRSLNQLNSSFMDLNQAN